MNADEIAPGLAVFHRANPGRLGILTGNRLDAMFMMAEVDWGSQIEFVDVGQLVARESNATPSVDSDVQNSRYGTIDDLRRRITFEKLRGMLTDVFYSMKTSEIDFYPHQFKPVLRFVESATNRLLIADEVGLGKTIEAGLIWTEWQAREKARRLLVVCPPSLVPKWLRELQDRFQLPAEAADARSLLDLFDRFARRGAGLGFVVVTSYHALRPFKDEIQELLRLREVAAEKEDESLQLVSPRVKLLHRIRRQGEEATQNGVAPFIEMAVFDEAHAMKNTGAATYTAGEILSGAAGAALCLSATPIHNASRDLFALLRLIDPDVFRDEYVFDLLRRQNLPVVRLQNALNATDWEPAAIQPLVAELSSEVSRTQMREALRQFDGSPRGRVELRHTAERMNLLGTFINRTRKRDVIENRVVRQPVTFTVTLTEQEGAFYRAVFQLVRSEVRRRGDAVTSFHLIHPALRMSSSLPVIASEVRSGKWGGFAEMEEIAEDFVDEFDVETADALPTPAEIRKLSEYDFEANDSKYHAFREALGMIVANDRLRAINGDEVTISARDKVIVFAFFKSTIAYLLRRLTVDGFKSIAVTGDIKDRTKRDELLTQFGESDDRILLCSEIGAEGLDLQFARIVVNYDLPWNPMRVEQRIGRVDRIGQKASSIVIVNFHVLDTIDGSIYSHLYSKIGIFEQSIGALEGILGEAVAKFTSQIFRDDLTMDQVAARAEQTADAVSNRAAIEEQLENSTGALVAFQDLLSERVGESQRLGRFIRPAELRLHALDFLTERYVGSDRCLIVADNPAPDCIECTLSYRALGDLESFCQRLELPWPAGFSRESRAVQLTFDPAVHQSRRGQFRRLCLVTHLHPFFRWITSENETTNNGWHKVSAVRVGSAEFPAGEYFYLVYRMTLECITRRDAFHYAAKCRATGEILVGTRAELLLSLALQRGESLFPRQMTDRSPELNELRGALAAELTSVQRLFRQEQTQKLEIRRQQLTTHFDRRIEAQMRRISTAEERRVEPGRLLGFRRVLENLRSKRAAQLAKLEGRAAALRESFSEVACGFIQLENGPGPSITPTLNNQSSWHGTI